jgi:tellurite resistance protein
MSTVAIESKPEQRNRASIKNLPVNLFGSVMGMAGLSIAWGLSHDVFGTSGHISHIIGAVAIVMFIFLALGYLAKWVIYPDAVRNEFFHPVAGNFFGTITIAVLLLSAVIGWFDQTLQQVVWTIGAIATVVLSFVIVSRLLRGGVDAGNAGPAWLIPGVATLDIAVTGGTMPMAWAHEFNLFAVAIGTVVALVFYVMIFSRLVHKDPLPAGMLPSMMILVAPLEVGFLAYVKVTGQIDMFASLLFYFGLFMFAVVAWKIFRPSTPFSVSWWAISFPMAALVSASLKYAAHAGAPVLTVIAGILLTVLSLAIAILFVRTMYILVTGKLLRN